MTDWHHRIEHVNGIRLHCVEAGEGPLVLLVHGFPESWYSYRHQLTALAEAGYRAVAIDVRGYGRSSAPTAIDAYRMLRKVGDNVALVEALGEQQAIIVGHDWGAPIAWNTARLYPEKVRAVAGLSVPYLPVGPAPSTEMWEQVYAGRFFYQNYFQQPGVAEAELSADTATSLRMIYFAISGDGAGLFLQDKPMDATMLQGLVDPLPFPAWMSDEDLRMYTEAIEAGGWTGPLNRYRAQALDSADLGSLPDPMLTQPATFIGGELDAVRSFIPGVDIFDFAGAACTDFRGTTVVPGVGHWVQQEAPAAVNAALQTFVESLTA